MKPATLVQRQLIAFWTASILATIVLALVFLRVPEALGVGRHTVHAEFDVAAGLYEGAEVTYRGHPVGKVAALHLESDRVVADLSLLDDVTVSADVTAEVHSRSAVGEQYVALVPPDESSRGRLEAGDTIPLDRTVVPVEIGPVLDNVEALVASVDPENLATLIDETGLALEGRTGDLQALLDGTSSLVNTADASFEPTRQLIEDSDPLLTTVNGRSENIRNLTQQLDQVTGELRAGDADLRTLLSDGPPFAQTTTGLIDDLDETLPGLLEPLNQVVRVLGIYDGNLARVLTDYPKAVSIVQSVTFPHLADSMVRLTIGNANDPPECTKGFVPPEDWSSPFDISPKEVPLVYCQLPQDDPRAVRGARNVPCPNDPEIRTGDARVCLGRE